MIKMVFAFLAIFTAIFLGIQGFISATGREQLQVAKIAGYSLTCSILAFLIVASIVILF
jgi:uncharacterized membrane protein